MNYMYKYMSHKSTIVLSIVLHYQYREVRYKKFGPNQ